ncbi:hypothetical protein [Streptomyces cahuitamycinicus]|uniref:Uncharacterized protein n=1 Tax=Streptomyces cahuitamycinicus TaxID=2070367 RepID=A0A2N8TFI2_9ACTN|nr:hypothetical protein [Streptomyces cahuitamycinicus]PNG17699.1 hypothetical protein C1J00_35125 [Streptomyces cahuitamycinicus]
MRWGCPRPDRGTDPGPGGQGAPEVAQGEGVVRRRAHLEEPTCSYAAPASARTKSADAHQELTTDIVRGSGGTVYLSPGVAYDALEPLP